jgi:hypothetical protein
VKIRHRFYDIDVLIGEIGTLVAHYKNEGVYNSHEILFDGNTFTLTVDIT